MIYLFIFTYAPCRRASLDTQVSPFLPADFAETDLTIYSVTRVGLLPRVEAGKHEPLRYGKGKKRRKAIVVVVPSGLQNPAFKKYYIIIIIAREE